jgi:hypothetical protein
MPSGIRGWLETLQVAVHDHQQPWTSSWRSISVSTYNACVAWVLTSTGLLSLCLLHTPINVMDHHLACCDTSSDSIVVEHLPWKGWGCDGR